MSFLRGSVNYVWSTTSVLGRGATGAVYQGVNKQSGEPVAVKTFNQMSHARPYDVQMREFEVLKKVKHENIVKLLAIEEEQEGRGKVIVMELCTGGSLFNILDDPENTYGLEEKEYLLVVSHLTAGMKHLRENNLVHRDLKPGNIMKYVAPDGLTIYKLTDFGAARELDDDQQFMSLYGTEEYLHPDMYERAVLKKSASKTFGATVDLWSIGVTLYHVATGSLPFRPFGGRRNKETMHDITTKKASGVISGIQTTENGLIEWNRHLPDSCLLSYGLKQLITPLLAGLLEVSPQKMWTFERFFSEVTKVLSCCKLHVYYVNELNLVHIYMRPHDKYDDLSLLILEQTDITPENQILIFQDHSLDYYVNKEEVAAKYPLTSSDNPILLFHRQNNNVKLKLNPNTARFPSFSNIISMDSDASTAKVACSVAHGIKRVVDRYCLIYKLVHHCALMMSSVIMQRLSQLKYENDTITRLTDGLTHRLDLILNSQQYCNNLLTASWNPKFGPIPCNIEPIIVQKQQKHQLLCQRLNPTKVTVNKMYSVNYIEKNLNNEWKTITSDNVDISRACNKSEYYVQKLRESWQHLLRDKAARSLTFNEEQFHMLEKIKVQENCKSLLSLIQGECHPAVQQLSEKFADWYKMAQTVFVKVELLHSELDAVDELHSDINGTIDEVQETFINQYGKLVKSVSESKKQRETGDTMAQKKVVAASIQELETYTTQISRLMVQNSDYLIKLQEMLPHCDKQKFNNRN